MQKQIIFEPFAKQIEFIESVFNNKYNFILFGGAIRGGKTFAGLGTLILLCKKYPKSRWVVIRKDLPTIKRNLIPAWNKIKPINFLEKENNSEHTYTFKNGSEIIFFSESITTDRDLDRWRGLECNGFLFEEISECSEDSFQKAFERAGSNFITPYPQPIILATCNPTQNWVKDKIYNRYKNNTLPENWLYIQSRIYDNTYIPKEYIESVKSNMSYFEREVFVEGNWEYQIKASGAFWKDFEASKHISNIKYNSSETIHITIDNNAYPYIAIQGWQVDANNKIIKQIFELPCIEPNNNVVKAGELLIDYLNDFDYSDVLFVYGDTTTQSRNTISIDGSSFFTKFINTLKNKFNVQSRIGRSNPSITLSANFVNDIYREKLEWKILIDESCKISISDYLSVKEDKDGKMLKEKEIKNNITYEKNGHFSDCKRYFIIQLLESEYNRYKGKGAMSGVAVAGW